MAAALASRMESWVRDQAARLQPWAAAALPQAPRWPAWPWPGDRRRQRERMFREEYERRSRQLRELCRAVRVDTAAELQELLCAMVLAECVYKRPVSEMMRYINKFKSDFGGNIASLERVQPSLDHVPHRYLLAEAGDTLFATFIGTKQYKDIIADVNILQGTLFHEDTAQDLAPDVDPEQNDTQKGEENHGKSYQETSKKLRKSKPAVHRGFLARANGIPALDLYNLAQKRNRKLVLCGHSLGGAVAALATLAILRAIATTPSKEDNRLHVKCITFSQPPVGNAALRDYVHKRGWQDFFKSYCIPEDLVPRILSPAYFHHYNAQTPEASFINKTGVKSEETMEASAERPKGNNGEQLVLGVGPVQKSLWRLSKLVPLEGVRKSLSVIQKQTNVFGKAPSQLDSYLQSKVDESEESPQSLEIQESSQGIALTPLSDKDGGNAEDNNRTKKINASEAGGSKRWSRVPSLPSYVPFGELYLLGDSSVNTLSDSEYSKMMSELPLEVGRFKEELLLGLHDISRKTDLVIAVHNLAHRIPQYQQSNTSRSQPALSLLLDEAKALSFPCILAITNKFSVSAHEQNTLISSAMEAYQASPEMTKVVNSSPFQMPSARNSLQRIRSAAENSGNKDPANRSAYLPVNFALSPFQRKDIVMHVEGVSALRQLVHQVVLNNEEPAFEELARERLLQELAREKAASLHMKQKPLKRDGSVTAAAVGASLGAGLGIVMAVIMGAASALRKP